MLVQPAKHPILDASQRRQLVEKCLELGEDPHAPSAWFHFHPLSSVKRENFVEWMSWAIFSTPHDSKEAEEFAEEMEGYLELKAEYDGKSLEPGHSTDVKAVKVTLDPVVTSHRPLLWYLVRIMPSVLPF